MRWQLASTFAVTAMSSACYGPNTVDCGDGFFCPEGKVCVGTSSCGEQRLVEQCFGSGKPEFATCEYAPHDGDASPGVCRAGVCAPCTADLANCGSSTWTPMTFPGTTKADLRSIWVLTPTDPTEPVTLGYAGGVGGTLLRYDGEAWASITSPTAGDISALWGSSESDIYAVDTALYHFDGAAWSALPAGAGDLKDVAGSSASDVYAVGVTGLVVHFDGTTWNDRSAAGPTWNAVTPLVNGGMVAVGTSGYLRVNDDAPMQLSAPYNTSEANLKDVFLNGDVPTLVGTAVMGEIVPTIFERQVGGAWQQAPQSGIGALPLHTGWGHFAAGPGGRIVQRSEAGWTVFDSTPAASDLQAMSGARKEVFVVGNGGAIWRYLEP